MKTESGKILQSTKIIHRWLRYAAVNKFTWKSQWITMRKICFSILVYIQWVLEGGEELALRRN